MNNTMYVFTCPKDDTALVARFYGDTRLPFATTMFPMPINLAIGSLLVDCFNEFQLQRWCLTSLASNGYNTRTTYERISVPDTINPGAADDKTLLLEFCVYDLGVAGIDYQVGVATDDNWSFLMFLANDSTDERYWFQVTRNYHPKINQWMELMDLASFEKIYVEKLEW